MFEEMIKRAEDAAEGMQQKVDIRVDGLEVKIDKISVDLAEIKTLLRNL